MKFLALLKKELRECFPWLVLAAVVFTLCGVSHFKLQTLYFRNFNNWRQNLNSPIDYYHFFERPFFQNLGPVFFCISIALGLILALRQFWMPGFLKTWAFTLHRSVPRTHILCAKFTAAAVTFVLGLGVLWTIFFLFASRPGYTPIPPGPQIYLEGWIMIILGLVAYFGAALSALSCARWYTTKICGLALATGFLFLTCFQTSILNCLIVIMLGLLMLLSQIIYTFRTREF